MKRPPPPPPQSPRRRSRDRRRERRDVEDRRATSDTFDGSDRRRGARRKTQSRRHEATDDFYPEEIERIRAKVVELLKGHGKRNLPRFSCPRCHGSLTVHPPVRWSDVSMVEVTCSNCPRRTVVKYNSAAMRSNRDWFHTLFGKLFR